MTERAPYNPLDKTNLGKSVADALLAQNPQPLADLPPFTGAGIYAIYYKGGFKPYARLSALNQGGNLQAPIYVGKATPKGGRKGGVDLVGVATKALFGRLREHADSISAASASGIALADFDCRYLVVDDIWIPLGEALLIALYAPVWNVLLDGFGNHDPVKGRYNGLMPRWDVLHPGRLWATKCQRRAESAADVARDVESHLAAAPSLGRSKYYAAQQLAQYNTYSNINDESN